MFVGLLKHLKSWLESERHQSGDHIYSVHIYFFIDCVLQGGVSLP